MSSYHYRHSRPKCTWCGSTIDPAESTGPDSPAQSMGVEPGPYHPHCLTRAITRVEAQRAERRARGRGWR